VFGTKTKCVATSIQWKRVWIGEKGVSNEKDSNSKLFPADRDSMISFLSFISKKI
jgi:hypothetical protein